jgi:hypothetical protein
VNERESLFHARSLAEQVLDDGYPFPAEHRWWKEQAQNLGRYVLRFEAAMRQVIQDSPGTPDSVKKYLVRELEGSWGAPYEEKMTRQEYERATLDDARYDAREYLVAGVENQAEWWEHLGDAHRDYAALARLAVAQADELAARRG